MEGLITSPDDALPLPKGSTLRLSSDRANVDVRVKPLVSATHVPLILRWSTEYCYRHFGFLGATIKEIFDDSLH